jgi:GT2 family glycosyltransferase
MHKQQLRTTYRVAAVVVNWRAAEETIAAVRRLQDQSSSLDQVYVVDNGSGDGSAEILQRAFSQTKNVNILSNKVNLGFGGGCNHALRQILKEGFDYVWLLNNDARPDTDCLQSLLTEISRDSRIGMVGSMLSDPADSGHDHSGNWLHPWLMNCGAVRSVEDLKKHQYSWVTAASVLIRASALHTAGIFDENFFMYWEDADLAMRIRKSGYRLSIAHGARVTHRAGTSSHDIPIQRYLWHYRSQHLWLQKHHRYPQLALLLLRLKFLAKAVWDLDLKRTKALLRL